MNFRKIAEIIARLIGQEVYPFGKGIMVMALLDADTVYKVRVTIATNYGYNSVVGHNPTQTLFYLTPIDKLR